MLYSTGGDLTISTLNIPSLAQKLAINMANYGNKMANIPWPCLGNMFQTLDRMPGVDNMDVDEQQETQRRLDQHDELQHSPDLSWT